MPLIDNNRFSGPQAWRRWSGGLGLGMVPKVPHAPPRYKPAQAFATPPSSRGRYGKTPAASVPVTSKQTAFIAPVAPPTSNLPKMAAYAAQPVQQGVMTAPRQMTPTPQPGVAVFGVGLQAMNPNAAPAGRGALPKGRFTPQGLPQGLKFPNAIPSGGTPVAALPTKSGIMTVPPTYQKPVFTGGGYTTGTPLDAPKATADATTSPSTILAASDDLTAQFGQGGGGGGSAPTSYVGAGATAEEIGPKPPLTGDTKEGEFLGGWWRIGLAGAALGLLAFVGGRASPKAAAPLKNPRKHRRKGARR